MSDTSKKKTVSRRDVFTVAAATAGAAGAIATGLKPAPAKASAEDRRGALYRVTDHVKKAYATARF
ncbi:MAG: hypothetical protein FJX47_02765 [Alphaproteobacteria bacterium]|nr:hypothetical protein [Alphaproteobacteria bacterium]